jgi:hypothetical protein
VRIWLLIVFDRLFVPSWGLVKLGWVVKGVF